MLRASVKGLFSSLTKKPAACCTWLTKHRGAEIDHLSGRQADMFAKLETKLVNVLQGSKSVTFVVLFSARQKLFASLLDENNLQMNL